MRGWRKNGFKWEKGSITLLGTWLLGTLLIISMLIFNLTHKENQMVLFMEENLALQFAAEGLLEKERLKWEADFSKVDSFMNENKENSLQEIEHGEYGGYQYQLKGRHKDGRLILGLKLEPIKPVARWNLYCLQWSFEVDRENEKLILKRIG